MKKILFALLLGILVLTGCRVINTIPLETGILDIKNEGINYIKKGSSLKKLKRVNITMSTDIESLIKEWEK